MQEIISLCGDNCLACPRYNAKSEDELRKVAELWYRVGWRDCIVSNDEIAAEYLLRAYMLEGEEIFEDEDEKYYNCIKDLIN